VVLLESFKYGGGKVTTPAGKFNLVDLLKSDNDYIVVHLSKLEKSDNALSFSSGDIVSNGACIGYYTSLSESKTSVNTVCTFIRKSKTISMSWVLPLKGLKLATSQEREEYLSILKAHGVVYDKSTKQGLKVEPEFKNDDWISVGKLVGQATNCVGPIGYFKWAFDGKKVVYPSELIREAHILTCSEKLEAIRQLTLAGYGFTADWRIMELQYILQPDIRTKIGINEISVRELTDLVNSYKKAGVKGEVSIKLEV